MKEVPFRLKLLSVCIIGFSTTMAMLAGYSAAWPSWARVLLTFLGLYPLTHWIFYWMGEARG